MSEFLNGVLSSFTATAIIAVVVKWGWPLFKDSLYNGVRVEGQWDITEERNGKKTKVGKIELVQKGSCITGKSVRTKTREGKKSERKFEYHGNICGDQVTLIFEDAKGIGFDTGTYVFLLSKTIEKQW